VNLGYSSPYAVAAVSDRRRFPRVQADVFCRPAGLALFHERRNTHDVSLGGMRVYADEDFKVGSRLELDVFLPGESSVRCWAEVVWRVELGDGGPSRFDVGLKFIDMASADRRRLAALLVPAG
jgi:PilZ domain-containing protein